MIGKHQVQRGRDLGRFGLHHFDQFLEDLVPQFVHFVVGRQDRLRQIRVLFG